MAAQICEVIGWCNDANTHDPLWQLMAQNHEVVG
jgi:hypothetical protein